MAVERPQLGDTPAGKTLKPRKKPVADPASQESASTSVKKLIKNLATGTAYNATLPPWQDKIRGK